MLLVREQWQLQGKDLAYVLRSATIWIILYLGEMCVTLGYDLISMCLHTDNILIIPWCL